MSKKFFRYFVNVRHNSAALDTFAQVLKVINLARLWDVKVTWYTFQVPLTGFSSMAWNTALNSTWPCPIAEVFATQAKFLEPYGYCPAPSPFSQQIFLVASTALWPNLSCKAEVSKSDYIVCWSVQLYKSHIEWSNVLHASAPTTTILPTTVSTFHPLNCCYHVKVVLQTNTYQNIAELLTHPHIFDSTGWYFDIKLGSCSNFALTILMEY